VSGARSDAVIEPLGTGHQGSRRSLDFRDKTALDRLVATSSLDPTLAGQRRSASAKHLAREIVRRLDASMSCEVSHARLAKALGSSVDTIKRAQAVLV